MSRFCRRVLPHLVLALCSVVAAFTSVDSLAAADAAARPNILWLIAEDFGPHLGCYGTKEVSTPNLDRLAADGVRYTRFFATVPVCSPSRSAFMTGMYQTTIGAHNHRSHRDDGYRLPDGVRLLTDWMRDAGYFTANVRQFPEPIKFRGTGKTDWNFTYDGRAVRLRPLGRPESRISRSSRRSTFRRRIGRSMRRQRPIRRRSRSRRTIPTIR